MGEERSVEWVRGGVWSGGGDERPAVQSAGEYEAVGICDDAAGRPFPSLSHYSSTCLCGNVPRDTESIWFHWFVVFDISVLYLSLLLMTPVSCRR